MLKGWIDTPPCVPLVIERDDFPYADMDTLEQANRGKVNALCMHSLSSSV